MATVLICDPLESEGVDMIRKAGLNVDERPTISAQELLQVSGDYDAVIIRSRTKITKEVIEAGKKLKVIVRAGVGLDNVDVTYAKEKGVQVIPTPAAPTSSVAELAVGLMLAVLRQISLADRSMKEGKWIKSKLVGSELKEKTVGVVGVGGRIGGEVARILKAGFKANVIGYDIVDPGPRLTDLGVELVKNLDELLVRSDIVTVHVAYSAPTHHLLNGKRIATMKKGAILINTARGDIVDGEAMLKALKEGHLSGAGLDVFHNEPPQEDWEKQLVALGDGVTVCTCHIGAQTGEAQKAAGIMAAEAVIKSLKT